MSRLMKLSTILMCVALLTAGCFGPKEITVTGTVTYEGELLDSFDAADLTVSSSVETVAVSEAGTFKLQAKAKEDTLTLLGPGFKTKTYNVKSKENTTVDFKLTDGDVNLDTRNLAADSTYESVGKHGPHADYPDDQRTKLTDGELARWEDAVYNQDPEFVGFQGVVQDGNIPMHIEAEIAFDLHAAFTLTEVRIATFAQSNAGIRITDTVTIYVSDDGANWDEHLVYEVSEEQKGLARQWIEIELPDKPKARHVKIKVYTEGSRWFFTDEIEIHGM